MSRRWRCCATAAILASASALTGCCSGSSPARVPPTLYAPDSLTLPAGTTLRAAEGEYRLTQPELWHSHRAYLRMQDAALDAARAAEHARHQR